MKRILLFFLTVFFLVSCASAGVNITSFLPADTTPSLINGSNLSFSVNLSSMGNVTWAINSTTVQTNSSVTNASYLFNNVTGVYNVTVLTDDDSQTWLVTVEALQGPLHEGFWYRWLSGAWQAIAPGPTNNTAYIGDEIEVTIS